MTPHPSTLDRTRLLALGWAVFVACSWTWCIGMYLPVLMVRDFGAGAWLVFALPNVVGAAALGWVLHHPGAAGRLSREHWPAAVAFSVVTILFHAFFVGWVIRSLVGDAAEIITLSAAVGIYLVGRRGRRDLLIAAVLFAISVSAFITAASLPGRHPAEPAGMSVGKQEGPRFSVQPLSGRNASSSLNPESRTVYPESRTLNPNGLFYLAPVCVFGFLLCPYLDLTFLRARASTEARAGIAAFTIGFGVLFVVMITFTLWYARILQPAGLDKVPRTLAWIIGAHLMLQSAFTVALHTRAISEDPRAKQPELAVSFFVAIVIAFLMGTWHEHLLPARYNSGETVYRLFMAFYGLIFPAYIWICMVPTRRANSVSVRNKLVICGIAVLIAAPMFWLGFIENRMVWLAPGLGVVLVSRMVLYLSGNEGGAVSVKSVQGGSSER